MWRLNVRVVQRASASYSVTRANGRRWRTTDRWGDSSRALLSAENSKVRGKMIFSERLDEKYELINVVAFVRTNFNRKTAKWTQNCQNVRNWRISLIHHWRNASMNFNFLLLMLTTSMFFVQTEVLFVIICRCICIIIRIGLQSSSSFFQANHL